jgi:hypothetical protein
MAAIGWVSTVALECRDPAGLAEFYHRVTGRPVTFAEPDWYSLAAGPGEASLSFQYSPGHEPPRWPDPQSSMQFHLHVKVEHLDEAERAVLAIGATKLEPQPSPEHSRVFADPAGHIFCLVPQRR